MWQINQVPPPAGEKADGKYCINQSILLRKAAVHMTHIKSCLLCQYCSTQELRFMWIRKMNQRHLHFSFHSPNIE